MRDSEFFMNDLQEEYMVGLESMVTNGEEALSRIARGFQSYDIFDVLKKLAALSLCRENQNKALIIDALIEAIIREKKENYRSKKRISYRQFSNAIKRINDMRMCLLIDPNENCFSQNVMYYGNFQVFNGVDYIPAYRLQMLIYALNRMMTRDPELYGKAHQFIKFVLEISDELITEIPYRESLKEEIINGRTIFIPKEKELDYYCERISFDLERLKLKLQCDEQFDCLFTKWGSGSVGNDAYRCFYKQPFVIDKSGNKAILLSTGILVSFAINKVLVLADSCGKKDDLINTYNEYVFRDALKHLKRMGHGKILETEIGIELVNLPYYKEAVVSAYNNQLMVISYLCDDGWQYDANSFSERYPDERHQKKLHERIEYYGKKFSENGIEDKDIYHIIVVNSIGRELAVSGERTFSSHRILVLNSLELMCISINEREKHNFLLRYIRARSRYNIPYLYNELDGIDVFTRNNYSFYMDDRVDYQSGMIYIEPGGGVDYIKKALLKEKRVLVDSYEMNRYSEVVLEDEKRGIYCEDYRGLPLRLAMYLEFSHCGVWVVAPKIENTQQLDIARTINDTVSYWLAECKEVIESSKYRHQQVIIFNTFSCGFEKYHSVEKADKPLKEYIDITVSENQIEISWSAEGIAALRCVNNAREKELIEYIFEAIDAVAVGKLNLQGMNRVFLNPVKRKMFFHMSEESPWLKPIESVHGIRHINEEDEDEILDKLGRIVAHEYSLKKGILNVEDRKKIGNQIVSVLYKMLEEKVKEISFEHLVRVVYHDLEYIIYRSVLIQKRYMLDVTCYPERANRTLKEYNEWNRLSLSLRFFLEYVAATVPQGNKPIGIGEYEYILAVCALIIQWAYTNDLIFYEISDTPVEILDSGRIGIKKTDFDRMLQMSNVHRDKQMYYNSTEDFRKVYEKNPTLPRNELNEAFKEEFGYSFDIMCRIMIYLVEYGNKDIDVLEVEYNELIQDLKGKFEFIDESELANIIQGLSIVERNDYMKPPRPYRKEDVYPWRFNREYSLVRRPLVIKNGYVYWGRRGVYSSLVYTVNLIYDGRMKARKQKLKTLLGKISDERGDKFNHVVAEMLRDMNGFEVYENIKRINKRNIADEKGNTLGDIDILLIDRHAKVICIFEVKDFNYSRNPYEMHIEYEKLFCNTEKDRSYSSKHLRRVSWIQEHMSDLRVHFSLDGMNWKVREAFIVSEPITSSEIYKKRFNVIYEAELTKERLRMLY